MATLDGFSFNGSLSRAFIYIVAVFKDSLSPRFIGYEMGRIRETGKLKC
jgi:hypothetical protein